MQIQKLETILNEILINLPFCGGQINKVNIWKDYEHQKGAIIQIEGQEQDKSVFDFKKIYLKIDRKYKNGCQDSITLQCLISQNPENLLKSLINSILAFLKKKDASDLKTFEQESKQRDEFFEAFKIKNSNYFNNSLVYPTTYGLGYYCLFMNQNKFNDINKKISQFLESNLIAFKNEFSDACWVYRFKFKSLKENNIKLLANLILEL